NDGVCEPRLGSSCDDASDCGSGQACRENVCCSDSPDTQTPSGSEPGECVPGNACGGISSCRDYCYSDRCCTLICGCSNDATLLCDLECLN
ncbi:MAG: hypothetical protein KC561_19415, partial [Myxococcales bacterium]|nr:hypothetical protein [Myxococcales bacterium]